MANVGDTGVIINASELLGGVKLSYGQGGHEVPFVENPFVENVGEADDGSPLTQVATALKESFFKSSWAVAGSGTSGPVSAGAAPEVYTTALRAALVEYGDSPTATLPDRLRAADGLAAFLGMSSGAHEALMLRALAANEKLVMELQAQAHALRHHRCGLTSADFTSKEAYATWRARALRSVRAALLAQQRLPEYNALLEVSLLGANELAVASKGGKGFMCCFLPDIPLICPYAWAHLVVPSGAGGAGSILGARTQHTQVLMDSGPNPSWQAVLQPLTLTNEQSELRLKVSQCGDPRGNLKSHDQVLGVSGITVAGLQPAVTQQVVLPLYEPPPHPRATPSSSAPVGPNDHDPNVFYRVVYDTANDEIWGIRDLKQQGKIVLQLRYIVERRTRYDVPNEAVFCGSWHEGDSDEDEGMAEESRVTSGSVFSGGKDERLTTSEAIQKGSEALQKGIGKGVEAVVTGAKVTVDYLQHLTTALAQGLTDNALTNMVGINGSSKIRHVAIQLVGEPVNLPRTPSITKLNTVVLIKQLAMALASAARTGRANEPAAAALSVLPMMPAIPEDIRALMLSPSQKRANQSAASGKQNINKRTGQPVRSPYTEAQQLSLAPSGLSTAVQETWSLLEDAMVKPYLPFGPAIGVFLRAGLLLCLRVETMLILVVQHMLGDWPAYIGSTIKGRGGEAQAAWGNSSTVGGAQDYLHALRVVWEKCLTWHAGGSLVQDETEGIKGIMGLLLSRILPAIEQHYTVFVGKEGPACFTMLLEMVGWAWTWDPKAPTPHDLLTDYLKDTATQTMKQDFRVSAATLTKDIERLVTEVEIASECLKRDRDIQLLMPGMKGFAAYNAAARYDLIYDHLEALALYEPGNSLEAMQKMFDLEVVLMDHHRLLVEDGYARALPPCPVPKHLLPNKGADAGAKTDAKLPTPAVPDAAGKFTSGGLGRDTAGDSMPRSSQIRQGARHEAVTNLWDWEDHFIKELCRWVRVGVADLDGRVTRLLEAETWVPASRTTSVSNSSLELTKLIEAHATAWLDAACAGSEARRLHVGLLVTACLGHVHHHYIAGATAIWEQELAAREALFTGMKSTTAAPADSKRSAPSNGALGADAGHYGGSMSASPLTGPVSQSGVSLMPSSAPFIPGLASASAPVLVRVISLQVGMTDPSQVDDLLGPGIPLPAATVPPGPRHGHKRSASQSTVFASNLVLGEQFGNVPALRALVANALSDHQGICLTKKMAVIRASMHRAMQEAKEVGVFLLQCLVLPFVTPTGLPRTGSELLDAAAAKNKGRRTTETDSDDDSDVDAPVRPTLSSMRGHSSANPRSSGSGDGGWGRKKEAAPGSKNPFSSVMVRNGSDEPDAGAGWARKKPANASIAGRLSVPVGKASDGTGLASKRSDSAEAGQPVPISNFVGAYWQELQRRTAAVITSLVSSYSVTLRSALVSMMVASCGVKRDPVKPEEHAEPTILSDLLRAVDEELTAMSQGMDGEAVLVAEMTGALWRAATSALQLLALNQAGFRPLTEQECENLREFLLTLQKMYENDVPKLVNDKQPPLNWEKVSDPRYPQELAALNDKLAVHSMRQFSGTGGLQPQPIPPELLASLDVLTPVMPEDDAARRSRSRDYCAALLQLAPENASVLQDMYRSQEASMHYAQPLGAAKAVYIPLSPQQLPLLDLLRLMRARRVHEKASAAWADQMLKEAGAVITQVLFGLVGSERVVAEFKCVLAGASKSAGRLIITQGTLCFTTMLDTDAKAAFDTTLSILRSKVVSVSAGCEAGSLVLTTSDHDILAFTTFASTAERDRLMTLLTSPAQQQGPGGRVLNASTTLKQRDSSALQQRTSVATVPNGNAAGKVMPAGATAATGGNRTLGSVVSPTAAAKAVAGSAAVAGAATGVVHALAGGAPQPVGADGRSAFSELVVGGRADSIEGNGMTTASFTTGDVKVAGPTKTRRPPNRDPWAARAAREAEEARAAEQAAREAASVARREEEAKRAAAELARLEAEVRALEEAKARANPPPPPASPPSAPSGEGSREGSQAPDVSDAALIMSVPCSLYGTIYDTPGVLWVYEDRIEFVSKDAVLLHRVAVSEVMSVTQYTGYIGGTRLVVKVDQPNVAKGVALLEFTGLSDALITSLKQSIIDLT